MTAHDLYLRITRPDRTFTIECARVWNADLFINSMVSEHAKEANTVETATREDYLQFIKR